MPKKPSFVVDRLKKAIKFPRHDKGIFAIPSLESLRGALSSGTHSVKWHRRKSALWELDMKIDEAKGVVTFDRLVRADRSLGSDEAISMPKPAEKAVAKNAQGVFANRSLVEIHSAAKTSAAALARALSRA